jgi:Tfp pilus assembly protein PilO
MRIMNYIPDPLYKTAALPRILTLRRLKTRSAMTPREQSELKRLEASQQDMEYDEHRRARQAATARARKQKQQRDSAED